MNVFVSTLLFGLLMTTDSLAQGQIERKHLLTAELGNKSVTTVEVRSIEFKPEQQTGLHKHPCPVVGYIVEGAAFFQVEGQSPQELKAGSAFYEPADTPILHFDNRSKTKPLKFVANYLLNGKQELIEMLPASKINK